MEIGRTAGGAGRPRSLIVRTLLALLLAALIAACGGQEAGVKESAVTSTEKTTEEAGLPSGGTAPEKEAAEDPRYLKVSVYLTTLDNVGIEDAKVTLGDVILLPSPEAVMGMNSNAGLYDTEEVDLEGGSYFFRAEKEGFRPLAGRVEVFPFPETVGRRDPPRVLELADEIDTGENLPGMKALILWQKYIREQERAHPKMPSRGEPGYHSRENPSGYIIEQEQSP